MINFSPQSTHCPAIVLDVVNLDGTQIQSEKFRYDAQTNHFWISSKDKADMGQYQFKIQAGFEGDKYTQISELVFNVLLIDYCASAVVKNPGHNEYTLNYSYQGIVEFNATPLVVSPEECEIKYTCHEPLYGLCSLDTANTSSSFDEKTARFSFATSEFQKFRTQSIVLQITGLSALSSQSFNLTLNMVDPCESAVIDFNPYVVDEVIYYPIMEEEVSKVVQIDTRFITLSNQATICPQIIYTVVNGDETALLPIFQFDSVSKQLLIKTDDVEAVGEYSLKLIASFDSEIYRQKSKLTFKVKIQDFKQRRFISYEELKFLEFPER